MITYLRQPTTLIWLLLVAATGASWWLGHQPDSDAGRHPAAVGLILIAAIKVRVVVRHFMEVRQAPRTLRWVLDGWLFGTAVAVLGIYWVSAS